MSKVEKPSKTTQFETFTTPEDLADLLQVSWSSMRIINDEDEVELMLALPKIIEVKIIRRKKKEGRSVLRVFKGGREKG